MAIGTRHVGIACVVIVGNLAPAAGEFVEECQPKVSSSSSSSGPATGLRKMCLPSAEKLECGRVRRVKVSKFMNQGGELRVE
jgi:hypothetical protein